MTGIQWKYSDYCTEPDLEKHTNNQNPPSEVPSDQIKAYPTLVFGIGQRYFVSKSKSYNISIKSHSIFYKTADGECDQNNAADDNDTHSNITMQFGATKFF